MARPITDIEARPAAAGWQRWPAVLLVLAGAACATAWTPWPGLPTLLPLLHAPDDRRWLPPSLLPKAQLTAAAEGLQRHG